MPEVIEDGFQAVTFVYLLLDSNNPMIVYFLTFCLSEYCEKYKK